MSKMRFFALQELANRRPVKVDYPSEKLSPLAQMQVITSFLLPWLPAHPDGTD